MSYEDPFTAGKPTTAGGGIDVGYTYHHWNTLLVRKLGDSFKIRYVITGVPNGL